MEKKHSIPQQPKWDFTNTPSQTLHPRLDLETEILVSAKQGDLLLRRGRYSSPAPREATFFQRVKCRKKIISAWLNFHMTAGYLIIIAMSRNLKVGCCHAVKISKSLLGMFMFQSMFHVSQNYTHACTIIHYARNHPAMIGIVCYAALKNILWSLRTANKQLNKNNKKYMNKNTHTSITFCDAIMAVQSTLPMLNPLRLKKKFHFEKIWLMGVKTIESRANGTCIGLWIRGLIGMHGFD